MNRRGLALGFTIGIIVILFLAGLVINNLSRGIHRQLEYSDSSIRAQYIAESGINALISRLLSKVWDERWFAGGPDAAAEVPYAGGTYDYFVQDTAGRPLQADMWVRSTFKGVRRAYFWRVKFARNLFAGLASGLVDSAMELDPEKHPATVQEANDLAKQMDEMIAKRAENQPLSQAISSNLQTTGVAVEALSTLGAKAPETVESDIPLPQDNRAQPAENPVPVTQAWSQPDSVFDPPGDAPDHIKNETPAPAKAPPPPRYPPCPEDPCEVGGEGGQSGNVDGPKKKPWDKEWKKPKQDWSGQAKGKVGGS